MSESWRGTVTSKPSLYVDGDQKLTIRAEPAPGSLPLKKGDVVIMTRADAPPPTPEPTPIPTPTPTPTPTPGTGRQLLGGWRLTEEFARGAIAIDFATMRCWMVGHAQKNEVLEYQLPAMGAGTDINAWPALTPTRVIPSFWQGDGFANGLCFWRGKLWAATRVFYAQGTDSSAPLRLYAQDGEVLTIASLQRQKFGGFVKRGPGLDPLIGCGGYESGQGSTSGPTLATLDGQALVNFGDLVGDPGPNLENWNRRAPRAPNYRPLRTGTGGTANPVPEDSWVGWIPRTINGTLEGRWASDKVYGGGLVLPEGITFWPWMGTGDLDYAWQVYTFAPENMNRTYAYRYDPATYQFLGFEAQPQFDTNLAQNAITAVLGQELGPDGKVYLNHGYQWQSGGYVTDAALKVFG